MKWSEWPRHCDSIKLLLTFWLCQKEDPLLPDHGWPWVNETTEGKTMDKRGLLYSIRVYFTLLHEDIQFPHLLKKIVLSLLNGIGTLVKSQLTIHAMQGLISGAILILTVPNCPPKSINQLTLWLIYEDPFSISSKDIFESNIMWPETEYTSYYT